MRSTHRWDVSVEEALAVQERLRPRIQRAGPVGLDQIHTVAGLDAAYDKAEVGPGRAAVVVYSFPELRIIEQATAVTASVFPYIPGMLSFREGPVLVAALAKLTTQPDLLLFDGQGYALMLPRLGGHLYTWG